MVQQEYKSPFSITEYVRYKNGESTESGIIIGVRFTLNSICYSIVNDVTSDVYESIPLSDIIETIEPDYLKDPVMPTRVQQENNLFKMRVGYGEVIFGKPISILSAPHANTLDLIIHGVKPNGHDLLKDDAIKDAD